MMDFRRSTTVESGQMTVELAVVLPVLIVVAVIAVNALLFVSECASFDRLFSESVRVNATSKGYGQSEADAVAATQSMLEGAFARANITVEVRVETAGFGCRKFTGTLRYAPTLFGMGLRDSILGIPLPCAVHSASYVIDPYKPGVLV